MVNTTVLGVILAASILGANGLLIFESSQTQMQELNNQFNDVMNGTMGFFDNAWSVAQKFQDPNYNYNPQDLGNYTAPDKLSIGDDR